MAMGALITIPWLMFFMINILFAFLYHHSGMVTWSFTAIFLAISIIFIVLNRQPPRDWGNWFLYLGIMSIFACIVGVWSGIYNYQENILRYYYYEEGRAYTNVLPSEPAAAHSDAGKITFSNNARVDTTRAVGYKKGVVYCVAPIMDDTQTARVEYWAAGTDCCLQRADFNCDDAWNNQAKSGVVLVDQEDYLVKNNWGIHAMFMKAVKEAEAAFDIVSSEDPLFIRWVKDPQTIQDDYWRSAIGHLFASAGVYLLLSIIAGAMLQMAAGRAGDAKGPSPNPTPGPGP